jgi:uncharacterized membrane protein YecN with MAPEG domain
MVAMGAVAHRGNLDSNAQDRQLRVGLVALAVALVVTLLLVKSGAPPVVRAAAFLPFFFAAYGVLAAFYRVCGFTAIAGRRMTADGVEKVADRAELSAQRRSGLRVIVLSVACAALATALFVVAS